MASTLGIIYIAVGSVTLFGFCWILMKALKDKED